MNTHAPAKPCCVDTQIRASYIQATACLGPEREEQPSTEENKLPFIGAQVLCSVPHRG